LGGVLWVLDEVLINEKAAMRRFVVKGMSAAYHLVGRTSMKQFWFGEEDSRFA
jgi:hypothetical protein